MLHDLQLLVVTGKGGVGKTVIAAALGRLLAERGRRVLLLEADPRDNLHHLFAVEPSGGAVVRAGERMHLQNISPRSIMDGAVRKALKVGALSKRVLASPIYQHFAEAAPGLKEMMLLGYALQVVEGDADHDADVVVLDAPASGHGLSLLAAPLLVSDVIRTGPLGTMAARIAAHVADPERCGIAVATLAEEMPVQETLETIAALETRITREPTFVVANAVWPALDADADADAAILDLWRTRRLHNERELARLAAEWHGPLLTVTLAGADFGPALLDAVAGALSPHVERAAPAKSPARARKRRT